MVTQHSPVNTRSKSGNSRSKTPRNQNSSNQNSSPTSRNDGTNQDRSANDDINGTTSSSNSEVISPTANNEINSSQPPSSSEGPVDLTGNGQVDEKASTTTVADGNNNSNSGGNSDPSNLLQTLQQSLSVNTTSGPPQDATGLPNQQIMALLMQQVMSLSEELKKVKGQVTSTTPSSTAWTISSPNTPAKSTSSGLYFRDFMRHEMPVLYQHRDDDYVIPEGEVSLQTFINQIVIDATNYESVHVDSWIAKLGRVNKKSARNVGAMSVANTYQRWLHMKGIVQGGTSLNCSRFTIIQIIFALLDAAALRDSGPQSLVERYSKQLKRVVKDKDHQETFESYYKRILRLAENTSYCYVDWDAIITLVDTCACSTQTVPKVDGHIKERVKQLQAARSNFLLTVFSSGEYLQLTAITPGLRTKTNFATNIPGWITLSQYFTSAENISLTPRTAKAYADELNKATDYVQYVIHSTGSVQYSNNPYAQVRTDTGIQCQFDKLYVEILMRNVYDPILNTISGYDNLLRIDTDFHTMAMQPNENLKASTRGKHSIQGHNVGFHKPGRNNRRNSNSNSTAGRPLSGLEEMVRNGPRWNDTYPRCSYGNCTHPTKDHFTAQCWKLRKDSRLASERHLKDIFGTYHDDHDALASAMAAELPSHLAFAPTK